MLINLAIWVVVKTYRKSKTILKWLFKDSEARPWAITSAIFLMLTLMYWSQIHLTVVLANQGSNELASLDNTPVIGSNSIQASSLTNVTPVRASTPSAQPVQVAPTTPPKLPYATPTNIFPVPDKSKGQLTTATALLEGDAARKMQDQIIPKEGSISSSGLTFNLDTFVQLKKWDKDIAVQDSWKDIFTNITTTVFHPCCDAPISTKFCGCGHAIAMEGLTKKMLQDGKSEHEIRTELMQWGKYFFPRHYVLIGLALQKEGKDLSSMTDDANLGSITVEKYATDYLIY